MIKYEDECVGCHEEMGCAGNACIYRNVPHYYCDDCKRESEKLYGTYDNELCENCFSKLLDEEYASLCIDEKINKLGYDVKIIGG